MYMKKRYEIEKAKKMPRRNTLLFFIVLLSILLLCSCNSKNKTISKGYMDKVEMLKQNGVPTLQEVKNLDTEYYNLTPKQKELVTNYGTVKMYLDLDLDSIHSIISDIDNGIAQNKIAYKDVKDIEDRFSKLTSEEKKYVLNIDRLSKFKELNEYDKASIAAVKYLRQILKSSDSMTISEINAKKEEGNYFIKVNYSATNSFGGRNDDVVCLDVLSEFKIGFISLSDTPDEFRETSDLYLGAYLNEFKSIEYPVDCEKVLDNIDKNH